jgi:hypothetical protein
MNLNKSVSAFLNWAKLRMKIILSSDQSKFMLPEAQLIKLSSLERFKISMRKFGLFFLLGLAAVFIPVLHFFLVPLFLILSVVLGVKAYAIVYSLHFVEPCPCIECKQVFKSEFLLDENLRLTCNKCFCHYLVDIKK